MKTYQEMKAQARSEAVAWQSDMDNHSYSWGELAAFSAYFQRLGRRYGLLREFRENGVC